jgi:predicted alpha/beta superfamily hydrolase
LILHQKDASFRKLFPHTHYFEVESAEASANYGVWVTLPPQYDSEPGRRYPAVYQTDGNLAFPQTAPNHSLAHFDFISPLSPFVQVSVGYTEAESTQSMWVRNRDLLPPGEPVPEEMIQSVEGMVSSGAMGREQGDLYMHYLRNPAADKFHAFLEKELHPALVEKFRIDADEASLCGYSYGGLFAAYVAVSGSSLFRRIGAGSPGILPRHSKIFEIHEAKAAAKADFSGRRLHVTLGTRELTTPGMYQSIIALGTAEFLTLLTQKPLSGLVVTNELIPLESHLTGLAPAWFNFLRACHGAGA